MVTVADGGIWGCAWGGAVGSGKVRDCEHDGGWVPEAGLDWCGEYFG